MCPVRMYAEMFFVIFSSPSTQFANSYPNKEPQPTSKSCQFNHSPIVPAFDAIQPDIVAYKTGRGTRKSIIAPPPIITNEVTPRPHDGDPQHCRRLERNPVRKNSHPVLVFCNSGCLPHSATRGGRIYATAQRCSSVVN